MHGEAHAQGSFRADAHYTAVGKGDGETFTGPRNDDRGAEMDEIYQCNPQKGDTRRQCADPSPRPRLSCRSCRTDRQTPRVRKLDDGGTCGGNIKGRDLAPVREIRELAVNVAGTQHFGHMQWGFSQPTHILETLRAGHVLVLQTQHPLGCCLHSGPVTSLTLVHVLYSFRNSSGQSRNPGRSVRSESSTMRRLP